MKESKGGAMAEEVLAGLGWAGLSDVRETARATILTGLGGGFADPAWRFLSPVFFNDMPL